MTAQPLDLTSPEVTRRLLRNPRDWRERAVEKVTVGSAQFVIRERSLQCRALYNVVSDLLGSGGLPSSSAFVVLPLALMPKEPLLGFDVSGPRDEPLLLRRPDIAARETLLVQSYAHEAGLDLADSVSMTLQLLLAFTEGSWAAVQADARKGTDLLRTYLESGLTVAPATAQVQRLRSLSARAHRVLDPYSDSATDTTSAVESPFLAVPVLVEGGYVADLDDAITAVAGYVQFLEQAQTAATDALPSAAGDLLTVLADYGRHWELMVLAEVPLDRPFCVSYKHLAPAPVRGRRGSIEAAVVIADADSNHVEVFTSDPGTRIVNVLAMHPRHRAPAQMGSTSRQTAERHAFYVWEVEVDFRILLSVRLALLRRFAVAHSLLAFVVALVTVALAVRPPLSFGELAVTAGPTAAVASLFLVREPSTLASRLRLPYSIALAASVLALVAVTAWRFTTLP